MTFVEAYEIYGRDSMAIADATGLAEADAYNLIAARADRDAGVLVEPRVRAANSRTSWRRFSAGEASA